MQWYWFSLPYATYGVAARNGVVCNAAPIARWMIGKELSFVMNWCRARGSLVEKAGTGC